MAIVPHELTRGVRDARMRRTTAACVCLALAWTAWLPAHATAATLDTDTICGIAVSTCDPEHRIAPDIDAKAALLADGDGNILWARKPDKQRAMASTTKVMTALVALDEADLDEQVVVSKKAAGVGWAVGLQAGQRVSVRELIELALIGSSNDAAIALAEHIGGSVPGFAKLMNAKAAELGLDDTHFVNPHGLDAKGHHSSAADLARLSTEAMRSPEFRRIVKLRSVVVPEHGERPAKRIESTDDLLGAYRGLLGGKTGFTDDAGYSFVAHAKRDGITLTTVVLGARSSKARFQEARDLFDWGFENLRVETVVTTTETVGVVSVAGAPRHSVPVRVSEEVRAAVFAPAGDIVPSLDVPESISLPVYAGQPLGSVRLQQGDRTVATASAVAAVALASVGETVGAVPVREYLDVAVPAVADESSITVSAFDHERPVERSISLDPQLSAPVFAGETVGEITYLQDGKVICSVPVIAAHDVARPGLLARIGTWFSRGWRTISGQPTIAELEVAG